MILKINFYTPEQFTSFEISKKRSNKQQKTMAIHHKFYQTNFENGFQTHQAILDITPYKPEVMIIGTFNPNTPNANFADFFYGRNFFWPAIKNLFTHNAVLLKNRRMPTNGAPRAILNPNLNEILEYCANLKLTFADLVLEVLHNNNPIYQTLENDNVMLNGNEYNLIQDSKHNQVGGLQQLENIGQLHWNAQNIIHYLCENPQIKQIYFTRRPTGIWAAQWNLIINHECMANRFAKNIFTPSAAGSPVHRSMKRLLNHWVNNIDHIKFGRIDNTWLVNHGVDLNNF